MEKKLKKLGIDCPACQSYIHTPLEHVLFGHQFECNNCMQKFNLNQESKQLVIKQLQEMNFTF